MNKSEQINELTAALSKAQGTMTNARMDKVNPFFKSKYADLATIWDTARKPLSENGLSVTQVTSQEGDNLILETILMHSSGQYISGTYRIKPVKDDPQGIGSAMTYARRYNLSSIIGMAADEDDDGEAATHKEAVKPQPKAIDKPVDSTPKQPIDTLASKLGELVALVKEKGISTLAMTGYIENTFKVKSAKNMTLEQVKKAIEDIKAGFIKVEQKEATQAKLS